LRLVVCEADLVRLWLLVRLRLPVQWNQQVTLPTTATITTTGTSDPGPAARGAG
jgi:hypothetical protein